MAQDETETLWGIAYKSFEPHAALFPRKEANGKAALMRVAVKGIGLSFDSTNSDIRTERLSFEQLKPLKIGLLVWQGERLVIDGNHRVNGWLAANDRRERNALVITPRPSWPHPSKS